MYTGTKSSDAVLYIFRLSQTSDCKSLINSQTISRKYVPLGTEILSEGEILKGLYIIDEGIVKITGTSTDRPIELKTGNNFGVGQPLGMHMCCEITATTVTDCCLWFIENPILVRLEHTFNSLALSSLDNSVEGEVDVVYNERKCVRFNPTVKVVLMATKEEYQAWGLANDLWYSDSDYQRFRREHRDHLQYLEDKNGNLVRDWSSVDQSRG